MSKAQRKLVIKNLNPDAFSLYSVVANPRDVTPYDLVAACNNVLIESESKMPSPDVMSLVHYLLTDYFQLAHRTGLYNRQKELWEAIARVSHVQLGLVKTGMFGLQSLPVYEIDFFTSTGQPTILACLVKPQKRSDFDKRCLHYLTTFIKRINKLQSAKGTIKGSFLCLPEPISPSVLTRAAELAGGDDPVSKFEARLAEPANIPLDVLAMDYHSTKAPDYSGIDSSTTNASCESNNTDDKPSAIYTRGDADETGRQFFPVRLVHPQLKDRRSKSAV